MDDQLLTVKQVAARWGVDKMTVYRAIWAGQLLFVDLAPPGSSRARIRVRPSAADHYIESRESAGKAA